MVTYTCDPRLHKLRARAWRVWGQLELHRKTLYQKNK